MFDVGKTDGCTDNVDCGSCFFINFIYIRICNSLFFNICSTNYAGNVLIVRFDNN